MASLRTVNRSVKPLKSPKSPKATRILLLAVLAAGLSACSGGSDPSAAPVTPAPSATAPSEQPSLLPSDLPSVLPSASASTAPEASVSASASASSTPVAQAADGVLLGDVQPLGTGWITVAPEGEAAQKTELTPFTVVLDVQGSICKQGALPHKCTVEQLKKALKSGVSLYAKVTIKGGTAEEIAEIVPE